MNESFLNGRVVVKVGDLTKENVDAIVNAANKTLLGGGGVDGAIHRAGGQQIYDECFAIRTFEYPKGLPTGLAVITNGGNLPAKYVIHTVGPVYGFCNDDEASLLADCYRNCLQLAAEHSFRTIAFPSISTGAFHFPKHEAAIVASRTIAEFLAGNEKPETVFLVFFTNLDANMFIKNNQF